MLRKQQCRLTVQTNEQKVSFVRGIFSAGRHRVSLTLIELLTSKHICFTVLVSFIIAAAAIGQRPEPESLISKGVTLLREGEFKLYPVEVTACLLYTSDAADE